MAMTSVSVMMTVFVLNLHYRGPKKNEIPFWLQQLLSLSLANVVRTFRKSKKFKILNKNKGEVSNKKKLHGKTKDQNTTKSPPVNGLLLSYMNINEMKSKSRPTTTTDVSKFL
jgi:hypothetical protein